MKASARKIIFFGGLPCLILALLVWRNSWRPHALAVNAPDATFASATPAAPVARPFSAVPAGRFAFEASSYTLRFAPDGQTLFVGVLPPSAVRGAPYKVQFWDASSRKLQRTLSQSMGREAFFNHYALSDDGRRAALSTNAGQLSVWDVAAPQKKKTLPRAAAKTQWTMTLAFAPDAKILAESRGDGGNFVERYPGKILLWNVKTARIERTISTGGDSVLDFFFAPDGQTLIGQGSYAVQAWNLQTGARLYKLNPSYGLSLAVAPDFKTLATVDRKNTIALRDAQTGALQKSIATTKDRLTDMTFSPDSQTLLRVCNGIGIPWAKSKSGGMISFYNGPGVMGNGEVTLWDVKTGALLRTLPTNGEAIKTAIFSPDGAIVAASVGTDVMLWRAETGELLRKLPGHQQAATSLAFSPDGATLATGAPDGKVILWRIQ